MVGLEEIVIENIKYSEESIIFYTGLPDFITVQAVFEIESLILHNIINIILIIIYYRTWCWEIVYAICWWNEHVQFKAKTEVTAC